MLNLLRGRELSVGEIARLADMRQANVSQHLALLRSKKLVVTRREGVTIFYSLAKPEDPPGFRYSNGSTAGKAGRYGENFEEPEEGPGALKKFGQYIIICEWRNIMSRFKTFAAHRRAKQVIMTVLFFAVLFGGWFLPLLGYFIPACMVLGVGIAVRRGRKWCDWYAPGAASTTCSEK